MQLLGDISMCGATAEVFARPRPGADVGCIEIPQRSRLDQGRFRGPCLHLAEPDVRPQKVFGF
jgi:hypothetical protein